MNIKHIRIELDPICHDRVVVETTINYGGKIYTRCIQLMSDDLHCRFDVFFDFLKNEIKKEIEVDK